jgi:putative transposase
MVGARVRRQQVAYARGRGLSSRRACALLSVARSTLGYQSRLVHAGTRLVRTSSVQVFFSEEGIPRARIFDSP